jgi:serine protease AprX
MRKLVAALTVAAVAAGIVPAVHALTAAKAPVSPALDAQLASAEAGDRLLVLVHGTSRDAAVSAVDAAGLDQLLVLESIGVPAAVGTPAQIRDLESRPGVTYVEADQPIELYSDTARQATRTTEATTTFTNPDGTARFTGAGRSIAIVDGGVDGTHPMFQTADGSKVVRNLKVACHSIVCEPGASSDAFMIDVTDKGNDSDTISAGGHGTHVASIAGGVDTPYGNRILGGTAPGAKIVALSVGASLSIFAADVALDWIARNHADPCGDGSCPPITVVNNSYGPTGGGDFDPSTATAEITSRLVGAGDVMVWANGNGDATGAGGDGSDNRSNPEGQNPLPGVISVANYDDADSGTRDNTLHSSSSRGKAGNPATYPDVSAPGTNITAACRPYLAICEPHQDNPDFGTITGTSMAAPHVAGIVALLQEAKPGITPAEVEDALEDTAHRFTFGGAYEPDPTNATTPTSFDKGHGLVDSVAALDAVVNQVVTSSEGTCGGVTGTDATDEPQPYAVTLVNGPYDPSLDLTSVALTGDPTAETVTLTLGVVDLTDLPPAAGGGIYMEARFIVGGKPHTIHATRDAIGPTFDVDDVSADDITGEFNVDTNTITVTAPRTRFVPELGGSSYIGGVEVQSGRLNGVVILWADAATAGCGTIDVGGSAPVPAGPEGTAAVGSPYTFQGEPTTSASDPTGLDLTSVTLTGSHEDERHIQVDVPAGGTVTFDLTCDNPDVDDYDMTLTGPDGSPAGMGTVPGTNGPEPKAGESANGGCDEQIVVTNAVAGVYTLTVTAFATVEGTYTGTVTVAGDEPVACTPAGKGKGPEDRPGAHPCAPHQ